MQSYKIRVVSGPFFRKRMPIIKYVVSCYNFPKFTLRTLRGMPSRDINKAEPVGRGFRVLNRFKPLITGRSKAVFLFWPRLTFIIFALFRIA